MGETKKCPKCSGEMEEGIAFTALGGGITVWVKKGKLSIFGAPKTKSYSCLKCGFIENYVER